MFKHRLWWVVVEGADGRSAVVSTPFLDRAIKHAQGLREVYGPRTARIKLQRKTSYGHFRPYPEV